MNISDAAKKLGCNDKSATMRLAHLGYTVTCGRCGGSGQYSYNQISGSVCFGCNGTGKKLAPLTDAVVAEALARIASGELDEYFARAKAAKAIESKIQAFNRAYLACETGKRYSARCNSSTPRETLASVEYRAQTLVNAAHDEANDLALKFKYPGKGGRKNPVEIVARIEELTALIPVIDSCLLEVLGF